MRCVHMQQCRMTYTRTAQYSRHLPKETSASRDEQDRVTHLIQAVHFNTGEHLEGYTGRTSA